MLATVQPMLQKSTPAAVPSAHALLGTRRPVSAAAVQELNTFPSVPSASPLFGSDPASSAGPPGNYSGASLNTRTLIRAIQCRQPKTGARG
jgi:hypothetical protein